MEAAPDPFEGKLTDDLKRLVVTALACFETPSQIVKVLKDVHGVEITRQSVERYNPERRAGVHLSDEFTALFHESRKQFTEATASIGIAHKVVRLARMEDAYRRANANGNIQMEMQILEQAAKEEGGAFTNRRQVDGNYTNTNEWRPDLSGLTDEQINVLEQLLGPATMVARTDRPTRH